MMQSHYSWQYDELKPVGRDYGNQSEVDVYDSSHADFRDIKREANQVLDTLAIKPGETIIEIGSGTGTFAIEAAKNTLALRRLGKAEDIANAVVFLASSRAAFITGQSLMVDGGYAL